MTIDMNDLLNSILKSLSNIDYIRPEEIPNIDLYMDQVTTFMDKQLASTKRYEDDKILTKTMINNYTKNHLLPPPVKKKYSREHVLILIFIYYFKNILSIRDIETILRPLTEKYFSGENSVDLASAYEEVCQMEKERIEPLQDAVKAAWEKSLSSFPEIPEGDERDEMKLFAFICNLSFDVYLKKMMIEKIIDELSSKNRQQDS
ncbi:MAG TPA: DUF1836 domain-containing protein [Candidatus Mediterraneibacter stercoravium]|mgnify:FL=1|uniref:DUF1836 domain-containing protein n=1 Tax=Candidatus Mediterraneibacter stercoravium TaxID=2838685 RepID=A0A9D2G7W7_9FIRM|nr:DUF1836 domain-containing protein [Candidatus Mediterraneibacter stercoravium]